VLSVDAIFVNYNISQGSVATPFRCGGICNNFLAADFPLSVTMKEIFKKLVNVWQRYEQDFGVSFF